MRRVYCLLILLFLTTACSRRDEVESAIGELLPLQVVLLSADFVVGQPRVSFALYDGPETAVGVSTITLSVVPLDETESVWEGTAVNYTDYEIPYWVFYPQLPSAGYWGITATVTLEDGRISRSTFILEALTQSAAPAVGEAAPRSQNKTIHTQPDLHRLSSGANPNPALYQMTVAEAAASGRPTVVGFTTPGLCQTQWCAPTLDSLEAVGKQVGAAANFIHIEVYDDFQKLTFVPQMAEWGLTTEPWLFVLDSSGRIAARLAGPVSPRELQSALEPLLP